MADNKNQVSISSTFYSKIFVQKFFVQLFSNYSLALYFFGERISMQNAARKMLMKLTTELRDAKNKNTEGRLYCKMNKCFTYFHNFFHKHEQKKTLYIFSYPAILTPQLSENCTEFHITIDEESWIGE